ncbi:MAG: FG-GAP repeat protein [Nitrospirae bacterium]|nr:FG-GAP repeat protein [Nitrospirota bacterium]
MLAPLLSPFALLRRASAQYFCIIALLAGGLFIGCSRDRDHTAARAEDRSEEFAQLWIPVTAADAGTILAAGGTAVLTVTIDDQTYVLGTNLAVTLEQEPGDDRQAKLGLQVPMETMRSIAIPMEASRQSDTRRGLSIPMEAPGRKARRAASASPLPTMTVEIIALSGQGPTILSATAWLDPETVGTVALLQLTDIAYPDADDDGSPNVQEIQVQLTEAPLDPSQPVDFQVVFDPTSTPSAEQIAQAEAAVAHAFEAAVQQAAEQGTPVVTAGEVLTPESPVVAPSPQPDTTPPDTAIVESPPSKARERKAHFTFVSTEPGSAFECRGSKDDFRPCAPRLEVSDLTDGSYGLEVRAVDPAGNPDPTPALFVWQVDGTPPETTISIRPSAFSNRLPATFEFSCADPTPDGASPTAGTPCAFECSLDSAAYASCTSPHALSSLSEGPHALAVRAIDPAGNADETPASFTWTFDVTPPPTPTLNLATTGAVRPGQSNRKDFALTIAGDSEAASWLVGEGLALAPADGAAWVAARPTAYTFSAEGLRSLYLWTRDDAGNLCAKPARTDVLIDLTPPSAPTGLAAEAGNRTVTLTWSPSSDATSGLSHYLVHWGTASGQYTNELKVTSTTAVLTGLVNCQGYFLNVEAVDALGNSVWGPTELKVFPELPAPKGVVAIPYPGAAEFVWDPVPNATTYEVCASSASNACVTGQRTNTNGSRALRLAALRFDTQFFAVRALSPACIGNTTGDFFRPLPRTSTPSNLTVSGSAPGQHLGAAVALLGDLDGDGRGDFAVGAPLADSDLVACPVVMAQRGVVRVISGLNGSILQRLCGGAAGDQFGATLAAVGDLNADGKIDFAVGAPMADSEPVACAVAAVDRGTAYVFSGSDGAILSRACGASAGDHFGAAVGAVADTNGGGKPDILVGAPLSVSAAGAVGKAYVYAGENGALLVTLNGTTAGDKFGSALAGLGDMNDDGSGDYAVGAPGADSDAAACASSAADRGVVHVVSGANPATRLARLCGDSAGDNFGFSLTASGDVDADATPDLIVGAPNADPGGLSDAGHAFVYSGATWALVYTLKGDASAAQFGYAVSTAGDMDGDGRADFAVGAPFAGAHPIACPATTATGDGTLPPLPNRGFIAFFSGETGAAMDAVCGDFAGDRVGYVLAWGGDVNNDGHGDLLAGAPFAGPTTLAEGGRARVILAPPALGLTPSENRPIALGVGPSLPRLVPGGSATFAGSGGEPGYSFTLVRGLSGGSLSSTGLFTAGPTSGVLDTVRVSDSWGRSWDTRILVTVPLGADGSPRHPSSLRAVSVESTHVLLQWTDRANNENGFRVEFRTPGEPWLTANTVAPDVTSLLVTGLSPKTTYQFRVRAYKPLGDSPLSADLTVTTP